MKRGVITVKDFTQSVNMGLQNYRPIDPGRCCPAPAVPMTDKASGTCSSESLVRYDALIPQLRK